MNRGLKIKNRGYIAVMSAIIISVLLLAITFSLSMTGFFARFNILNSEYKNISSNIAEGCIDTALYNLINDSTYNPINEIVNIGSYTCTIMSVTALGSQKIIKIQSVYPVLGNQKSYTNLQVTVTQSFGVMTVDNWQEVPHF